MLALRTLVHYPLIPRLTLITPSTAVLPFCTRRTMATLFHAIKEDHEEVRSCARLQNSIAEYASRNFQMYEYHDQYKRARTRGDVDAQGRWARQLIWEIARHAVGEEIVVYPLMERHLGEKGKQLADHDREEHLVRRYHSV